MGTRTARLWGTTDVIAEEALSTRGRDAPLSLPFRHQQVTAGYFGVLAAVCETQATLEKGGREGDTR